MPRTPINPIVPGQVGAFFEPPTEDAQLVLGPEIKIKRETSRRAGTVLDHKWVHPILSEGKRRRTKHGLYDESQRLYQTGGELDKFVFWKMKLVSLSYDAWR